MPSPSLKVKQHSNSQNHASQFFAIFLFLSPFTASAAEGSPLQVAPPVITSAVSSNGTAGLFFSYQITATNSPSNFFATGLPPGLTINPITGLISGTPANSGSFSVNLIASNLGGNGSATLIARISAPAAEVVPMSYFIVASVSMGVSNNISPVLTNSNIASARFFTVDYNHPSNFATFDDWMKNRMSSPLNGERVIAKPATYIQDQLSKPEQNRDILTINYSGTGQQQLWYLQPILPSVTTRLTQYQIPGVPPADCAPKSNFTTSQTLNGTVNISYGGTNYRMVSIMAAFPSGGSMDIKIAGGEEIVNLTNTFSGCYPGFSANQTVRGLPAKLEYLFGGTSAASPPADHLPTFSNVGANVRLSFVRRTDDSTLNHVVELNDDLASGVWQQVSTQPATESAGMDLQRWTYDIPTDGVLRRFYRIRAW